MVLASLYRACSCMTAAARECSSESDPRRLSAPHGPQGALGGLICSCPIIGTVSAHIPSSEQFSLTFCYRYSFRPDSIIGTVFAHIPSSVQLSSTFRYWYSFRPHSIIGTVLAYIPLSAQSSSPSQHLYNFLSHSSKGTIFFPMSTSAQFWPLLSPFHHPKTGTVFAPIPTSAPFSFMSSNNGINFSLPIPISVQFSFSFQQRHNFYPIATSAQI